jgi:Holliday junction resolvase
MSPTNKNKNYKRGYEKERKLVFNARKEGMTAFRSAGSHSPIDVIIIDHEQRIIKLIQCKVNIKQSQKMKLETKYQYLNGTYYVLFEAI